ncbi:unnamed protein product, partial [Mesorhabditis spiculigera]
MLLLEALLERIWLALEQHQARLNKRRQQRKYQERPAWKKNWATDKARENQWRVDAIWGAKELRYAYLDSKEEIGTPCGDFWTEDVGDFDHVIDINRMLANEDEVQLQFDQEDNETE